MARSTKMPTFNSNWLSRDIMFSCLYYLRLLWESPAWKRSQYTITHLPPRAAGASLDMPKNQIFIFRNRANVLAGDKLPNHRVLGVTDLFRFTVSNDLAAVKHGDRVGD